MKIPHAEKYNTNISHVENTTQKLQTQKIHENSTCGNITRNSTHTNIQHEILHAEEYNTEFHTEENIT